MAAMWCSARNYDMRILLIVFPGLALILPLALFAAVCICARLPRKRGRADAIIVLGARIRPDGCMSHALQYRCETALRVWREGLAKPIFLCGGQCTMDPCPEARVMKDYFLENGVPADCLIVEDASTNTIQNLRNAKEIMEAHGYACAAMITSDYHLTRALWIARDVGIDVWGIAAPSPHTPKGFIKTRFKEAASWLLYLRRKLNKEI